MSSDAAARLPRFIGIGPARTGTTWIHQVLQGHAGLPRGIKETDYFSTNYDLGLAWYLAHFRGYPPQLPLGEITPTYFDHPHSPRRIEALIPDCRIIATLRDPVLRLYSHYRLLRVEGWIGEVSFEDALERHDRWSDRPGNMIGVNRYATHLRRWFETIGRDRVLIALYDDLERDPQIFLNQITDFIEITRVDLAKSPTGTARVNLNERAPRHPHLAARARRLRDLMERRRMYRAMNALAPFFAYCAGGGAAFASLDPATKAVLRQKFRPEVEQLEQLIGRDLAPWKN